jgi:hypothetical protein
MIQTVVVKSGERGGVKVYHFTTTGGKCDPPCPALPILSLPPSLLIRGKVSFVHPCAIKFSTWIKTPKG